MLTTIKGTYANGVIVLDEQPPTTHSNKVIVTFMDEAIDQTQQNLELRKAGFGKGTFSHVAPNFDEPLEDLKDYM